jgi:hypothetical protein
MPSIKNKYVVCVCEYCGADCDSIRACEEHEKECETRIFYNDICNDLAKEKAAHKIACKEIAKHRVYAGHPYTDIDELMKKK